MAVVNSDICSAEACGGALPLVGWCWSNPCMDEMEDCNSSHDCGGGGAVVVVVEVAMGMVCQFFAAVVLLLLRCC